MDLAEALGVLAGLLGPGSGDQVVGGIGLAEQVHRDLVELGRSPAAEEQDLVVRGDAGQLAKAGFGLFEDLDKRLATVRVFEDANPGVAE